MYYFDTEFISLLLKAYHHILLSHTVQYCITSHTLSLHRIVVYCIILYITVLYCTVHHLLITPSFPLFALRTYLQSQVNTERNQTPTTSSHIISYYRTRMAAIRHQLQEVITRMTRESSQKDDTLKNLSTSIATLSSSLATKDHQIANLEAIRDRLTAQVTQQDQVITDNTADLNALNRQVLGVDTENALLKTTTGSTSERSMTSLVSSIVCNY